MLTLKYVEERLLKTPPIALMQVKKEIEYMIDLVEENTKNAFVAMETGNLEYGLKIAENETIVDFIKSRTKSHYNEDALAYIHATEEKEETPDDEKNTLQVPRICIEALRYAIFNGNASIAMIQRKCGTSFRRASEVMEWMEEMGYVSPHNGSKPRKVLITKEEFESKYGPL